MTEQPYKVHLSADGEPRECQANIGDCPLKDSDGSPVEHFSSKEEARAHYATRMESATHSTMKKRAVQRAKLDNDLYVTVLTDSKETLFEGFPDSLAKSLEPGDYTAMYHDELSDTSRYIQMSVSDRDEISYENLNRFRAISSQASSSTQQAVSSLKSDLERISNRSDPSTCKRDHTDRITLMESVQEVRRRVAIHDWSTATGASQGRADLEKIEWAFDHDLALAEEEGLTREANAISTVQSALRSFMQSTETQGGITGAP